MYSSCFPLGLLLSSQSYSITFYLSPFHSNKLYLLLPILLSLFYLYPYKYSFSLFRVSFPLSFETVSQEMPQDSALLCPADIVLDQESDLQLQLHC